MCLCKWAPVRAAQPAHVAVTCRLACNTHCTRRGLQVCTAVANRAPSVFSTNQGSLPRGLSVGDTVEVKHYGMATVVATSNEEGEYKGRVQVIFFE